jgi:hypothetical protein
MNNNDNNNKKATTLGSTHDTECFHIKYLHLYFMKIHKNVNINKITMKEPLVSKLTVPYISPLYHTGNNIFMKYN